MSIVRALLTAICIVGLATTGCGPPAPNPGIARVLAAREEAIKASAPKGGGPVREGHRVYTASYSRRLSAISAADCPKDFQIAWADYQEAWELRRIDQQRQANDKMADLVTLGLVVASPAAAVVKTAVVHGVTKLAQDSKQTVFDTHLAWFAVKKQCIVFDTPLPAGTVDF